VQQQKVKKLFFKKDLPDASFAGQQETFLNVRGDQAILDSCKKCFASLFTDKAISYRQTKGFDHFQIGLSIGIQKMVRSSKGASGVMFTLDTESGFNEAILITGSWGLGENIVQGAVNPDEWMVFKTTLKNGFNPIIKKQLGEKQLTMVYTNKVGPKSVKNMVTPLHRRKLFCLNDDQVLKLANFGVIIEDHYSEKHKRLCPMDIEWALDSRDNEIYIVQARPETVHSSKDKSKFYSYSLKPALKRVKLASGSSVGKKIGNGKAIIIEDVEQMNDFVDGYILITEMTDPNWEPILKKAAAVVTNRGGRTCHAAIISRELGIPCIVGTKNATETISNGQEVTVDCSAGSMGIIWEGKQEFNVVEHDLKIIPKTKTHICMNIGNPEIAFDCSFLPNDGVGLVRMEFIVANHIKVHPQALLYPERVKDENTKRSIEELTKGYKDKSRFFVDHLASGIGMIAAAFYPKPVILRFSDFKSNEYAGLLGGIVFEPKEENPMLGFRGASRYYSSYSDGFALECKAVKKIREEFGLTNLILMIPFCRTVEEAKKVVKEMEKNQLYRTQENGLKIYGMCEIPSNVLLAEDFLNIFDGYSIGSNDLTQLTLGVDRDSQTVSHLYDERNPAVKKLISSVIQICKKMNKYVGICGQAPSDYPDFTQFLIEQGIESISLNPDTVVSARILTSEKEKQLKIQHS
jgi:pyruvate, water dikinase